MAMKVSVAELEADLDAALNRVLGGERIVVERNGRTIALIVPAEREKSLTWAAFVALVGEAPRPDPGFADDLEAIQNEQGLAEFPEWRD